MNEEKIVPNGKNIRTINKTNKRNLSLEANNMQDRQNEMKAKKSQQTLLQLYFPICLFLFVISTYHFTSLPFCFFLSFFLQIILTIGLLFAIPFLLLFACSCFGFLQFLILAFVSSSSVISL